MKAFDRRGGSSTRPEKKRIYILRAALHVDVGYAPFSSDDSVHRPSNLKEGGGWPASLLLVPLLGLRLSVF